MARTATGSRFNLDPAHEGLNIYEEEGLFADTHRITLDVWRNKYRHYEEEHPFDSMRRVVEGVYAKDDNKQAKRDALEAMQKLLWIPAGRIHAGAGTSNIVTLLNCYVSGDIDDSMRGIADALKGGMLTMQQGGGDGFNFSTLRPSGAYLSRTNAEASGPLPFMDMWDAMCQTIMSAGGRRGAMMAVMADTHPDLPEFITAKQTKDRLTNFNVSVLVSDAFMDALKHDEDWFLGFNEPRADKKHLFVTEMEQDDGSIELWYAYSKWRARDLWKLITENTYEWSEPGVIFIDRINEVNNLRYCETITATNPCGEQPLPPHGCCNLGAVNLARMVTDPFSKYAKFDFDLLKDISSVGTRFLDNVIDVTLFPLEEQAQEEYAKRRIGLGITGLANALAQLGISYGSEEAVKMTEQIMECLANNVYYTSASLAKERGTFPLYDPSKWAYHSAFVSQLDPLVLEHIEENGVRNGVLLTIAPTGTTSLYAGNVSSGLEPVFKHVSQRNVRQKDDSLKPYTVYDYGYLLYMTVKGIAPESVELPEYMVEHDTLTPTQHILMQAACQQWIDASVSKTINCSKDLSQEAFTGLYELAYDMGLKGCTTYRPSDVRGSILFTKEEKEPEVHTLLTRPEVLTGKTYKVKWPNVDENYYITINDVGGAPFEVFIQSTSSKYADWTTALSLMISALMRKGGDISFIPEELAKVKSADDSGFVDGRYYGSLVALFGDVIGTHFVDGDILAIEEAAADKDENPIRGEWCPKCGQPTVIRQENCDKCQSCDYSRCG